MEIKTKIFSYNTEDDVKNLDEAVSNVNTFINQMNIKREDILEYHTKIKAYSSFDYVGNENRHVEYIITLSYIEYEYDEDDYIFLTEGENLYE